MAAAMQGRVWQGVRRVGRWAGFMGLAAGVLVLALACSGEPTVRPPVEATIPATAAPTLAVGPGPTAVRQGMAARPATAPAATVGPTVTPQMAAATPGRVAVGQGATVPAATVAPTVTPPLAATATPGVPEVRQGTESNTATVPEAAAPQLPPTAANISANMPAGDDAEGGAEPGGEQQAGETAESGAAAGDGGGGGSFNPEGQLTAAAWLDADRMYLADYGGRLRLLNVATGEIKTVWEGLTIPQGLTVLEGRLYVTDMGNVCALLAEEHRASCKHRGPRSDQDTLQALARSNAWILSFAIDEDGELRDRRIEVYGILARGRDHSANGLTNDGEWIYASIGNPYGGQPRRNGGFIEQARERLAAAGGRTDLMGVIARFRPGDEEVEVYATGLRNTYGIAIALDGTIYGVDNDAEDGPATGGQREELNAIVEGGFYGYPFWGTGKAPAEAGVTEPAAVVDGVAGTAVYANGDGVYAAYLSLGEEGEGFVLDRFDYETFTPTRLVSNAPSYITAILEREGLLYVVTFSGLILVVDPAVAEGEQQSRRARELAAKLAARMAAGAPELELAQAVYLGEGELILTVSPCGEEDLDTWFYLVIEPVAVADLPAQRREIGDDYFDFRLRDYGARSGERCIAVAPLPDYEIERVTVGRLEAWKGRIYLE